MSATLTAASLLAVASRRGVFTTPTREGDWGYVLLGTLGLDLWDETVLEGLRSLHAAGEIRLEACDQYRVVHSLVERGLGTGLIAASAVPLWAATVHAVIAVAAATTGATVTEDEVREYGRRLDAAESSTDAVNDALAIVDPFTGEPPDAGTVQQARARVAAAIDARRGVLPEAEVATFRG